MLDLGKGHEGLAFARSFDASLRVVSRLSGSWIRRCPEHLRQCSLCVASGLLGPWVFDKSSASEILGALAMNRMFVTTRLGGLPSRR